MRIAKTNSTNPLGDELKIASQLWGDRLSELGTSQLQHYLSAYRLSVLNGDLLLLREGWYITHAALLRIADARGCQGIVTLPLVEFCLPDSSRWIFRAEVFKKSSHHPFVGYGDADPSNVSPGMRGSELRIAETRAVNRALRKAYGIGLCSVEELGSLPSPPSNSNARRAPARLGANLEVATPIPLRDQLRQLIRHERLDPVLTKAYALEHLGVKSLRDASREQIGELVSHLQKRLFEDRAGFLDELSTFTGPQQEKKEVA